METADTKPEIEKKRKPPYGAIKWYEDFFALIERVQVDKVDSKFLEANNITSGDNVYAVINGLKFLGLLDDKGNATPKLSSLRVMGDEYTKSLKKVVDEAYADLESRVALEKAKPDDIANNFITRYDMPRSTALQAARVFVFFAQKAGIPLSSELIQGLVATTTETGSGKDTLTRPERKRTSPKPRERNISPKRENESLPAENIQGDALGRLTVKGIGYIDIKDNDTYEVAKAYMQIMQKQLNEKKASIAPAST